MRPVKFMTALFILNSIVFIACSREPKITFLNLAIRESNHQNYVEAMIETNASVKTNTSIKIDCDVAPTGTKFLWKYNELKPDKTFVLSSNDPNVTEFIIQKPFDNTGQLFKGSGTITCSISTDAQNNVRFSHQTQRIDLKN